MIIKLIRHGESVRNAQKELDHDLPPDPDIPITDKGIQQARNVGLKLGSTFLRQSLLYTSPYLRAKQSLTAILDGSNIVLDSEFPSVYEDPRLREAEWGFETQQDGPLNSFYQRIHPDGESPANVYDRVSSFLETFMRHIEKRNMSRAVIVSHASTIKCFVMRFFHLTIPQFNTILNPDNCDIITIATIGTNLSESQFTYGRWGVAGLRIKPGFEHRLGGLTNLTDIRNRILVSP